MEFRWQDNYVLEWVIDDVLRHILRKKNVFIEKAKLQMNHFNAAVLKRKRYDHLNEIKGKPLPRRKSNHNLNENMSNKNIKGTANSINRSRQVARTDNYEKSMATVNNSENYHNKIPKKRNTLIRPAVGLSKKPKSQPLASSRAVKDCHNSSLSNKKDLNDTSLNDITKTIHQTLISPRQTDTETVTNRSQRKRKPINYKRINKIGFDDSFVI